MIKLENMLAQHNTARILMLALMWTALFARGIVLRSNGLDGRRGYRMAKAQKKTRSKARIALGVLIVLILGLPVAWLLVEHYIIDADQYRADVVAAIEEATGLPASIRKLELDFLPSPRLQAHDVVVGDETFRMAIETLTAESKLSPLLRRQVRVSSVELTGFSVRVPSAVDELTSHVSALTEKLTDPSDEEFPFDLSIDSIRAEQGTVFVDDDLEPYLTIVFESTDVLSDSIALALSASSTELGGEAIVEASLTIGLADGDVNSITGSATASGVDLTRAWFDGAPEGVVFAHMTVTGENSDALDFVLDGSFDSEEHESLTGTLVSRATWREEGMHITDAVWESPGVEIRAEATLDKEGSTDIRIESARADRSGLDALIDRIEPGQFTLQSHSGAALVIDGLAIQIPTEGAPILQEGALTLTGLQIGDDEGAVLAADLQGRLLATDGLIQIEELHSDAFSLTGSLRPDFDSNSVELSLAGTGQLRNAHLGVIFGHDTVQEADGLVALERFAGTFTPDGGMPENLVIDGELEGGLLTLAWEDHSIRLTPITSAFHTASEGIRTTFRAESSDTGDIAIDGEYGYADRTWAGEISSDLSSVVTTLMPSDSDLSLFDSVLAEYSDSTLRADVNFPGPNREETDIRIAREGTPTLEVRAAIRTTGSGGLELGAIDAHGAVAVDGLSDEAFMGAITSGDARLSFARDPIAKRFEFVSDLSDVSVRYGQQFEKQKGDVLRVVVKGDAGESWTADETRVDLLEASFPIVINDDDSAEGHYEVEAARLAGLLPEGSTAHGTITGDFKTEPFSARAVLQDVGFAIDEKLRVDSISGALQVDDKDLAIENLRVTGAKSDYTLAATRRDGRWDGSLRGAALDLDTLLAFYDGATESIVPDTEKEAEPVELQAPSDAGSIWDDPLLGQFSVQLDKLFYRRTEIDKFAVRAVAAEESISFHDIYLRPRVGTLRGTVDIARTVDVDALLTAQFEAKGVDTHIVDEILYEESHSISGLADAQLDFSAPFGDTKSMLASGNGAFVWAAIDGSLGELGFATKLLSALRTVELIRLKAPSLRDKGLAYTTFGGQIDMVDGEMKLGEVQLLDRLYAMIAGGKIDFPNEKTNVTVNVHMMEGGVTKAVKKIPVLGQITKISTDMVGVSVFVSGSPYDIQTTVIPGGDNIVKNIGGLAPGVIKDLTDTLLKLVPRRKKP